METKFIAYYRVSTKRQNLGLDAQQATVTNYVRTNGGVIVSSYQEKEYRLLGGQTLQFDAMNRNTRNPKRCFPLLCLLRPK